MTATPATAIGEWRTSDEYAVRAARVPIVIGGLALVLALAYTAAIVKTDGQMLLLVPLVAALVGLAILAHPDVGVYLLFAVAILFEQWAIPGLEPITAQTRVFQNISTYTPIPLRLSLADLLMVLTLTSWAARRLVGRHQPFRMGPLGWAVAAYGGVFVLGTVIGVARGGWNTDAALAEARAPFQMCLLYFLTANLIRDRQQVMVLVWELVVLVGVKGLQGILNYQEAAAAQADLSAVTGHEDVVFFDLTIVLLLVIGLLGLRTRLGYVLLALLPLIAGAELLTERRVGFIALGAVAVAITILIFAENPRRGLVIAGVGALLAGAYLVAFWDVAGPLGEPIRALRSAMNDSSLSVRDQLSDQWRVIENRNIAFTMRQLPLTGVGVGQAHLFHEQQVPVTFVYWRYITHNALMWLWLKAGPIGAFVLWFLVARVLLLGSALYLRLRDPVLRSIAVVPVALIFIQVIFSSVELGLTYSRNMIVLGVALGLFSFLVEASARELAPKAA